MKITPNRVCEMVEYFLANGIVDNLQAKFIICDYIEWRLGKITSRKRDKLEGSLTSATKTTPMIGQSYPLPF